MRDPDRGERRMPVFAFRVLEFFSGVGNVFRNPGKALEELGIREGHSVLDFGCGPGDYTIAAARIVGENGRVSALDLHPLALEAVESKAERRGLKNVETIFSDLETGLADESVDFILLYGVLYRVGDKRALIREIGRILRPGGVVSVSGHRMGRDRLIRMMRRGKFSLRDSNGGALNFKKEG